jgi:hypothetical protein
MASMGQASPLAILYCVSIPQMPEGYIFKDKINKRIISFPDPIYPHEIT